MNIFVLSRNVTKCAAYHCDKHVVKMIVEYTQILSTVQHIFGNAGPMKATHIKHPSVVWASSSLANYLWLADLAIALSKQYAARYGKKHSLHHVIEKLKKTPPKNIAIQVKVQYFEQVMPDEYKHDDTIKAYRKYYNQVKSKFARRKYSSRPYRFKNEYGNVDA